MSKFKFIPSEGGRLTTLFHEDRFVHAFYVDDLPDLATAAQAALAEQNSGVMGETKCKCDPEFWSKAMRPVCNDYTSEDAPFTLCRKCDHDFACHS